MNASDLTITADKTESKIDGAVIASVKYVDASDPNAESSVYPTKPGSYKAIVTLTCPGRFHLFQSPCGPYRQPVLPRPRNR